MNKADGVAGGLGTDKGGSDLYIFFAGDAVRQGKQGTGGVFGALEPGANGEAQPHLGLSAVGVGE